MGNFQNVTSKKMGKKKGHYFLCSCALHNLKVPPGLSLCLVGIDHIIRIHVDLFIYNPQVVLSCARVAQPGDSKRQWKIVEGFYKMQQNPIPGSDLLLEPCLTASKCQVRCILH